MLARCFSIALVVTNISCAISRFVRPCAARQATRNSPRSEPRRRLFGYAAVVLRWRVSPRAHVRPPGPLRIGRRGRGPGLATGGNRCACPPVAVRRRTQGVPWRAQEARETGRVPRWQRRAGRVRPFLPQPDPGCAARYLWGLARRRTALVAAAHEQARRCRSPAESQLGRRRTDAPWPEAREIVAGFAEQPRRCPELAGGLGRPSPGEMQPAEAKAEDGQVAFRAGPSPSWTPAATASASVSPPCSVSVITRAAAGPVMPSSRPCASARSRATRASCSASASAPRRQETIALALAASMNWPG